MLNKVSSGSPGGSCLAGRGKSYRFEEAALAARCMFPSTSSFARRIKYSSSSILISVHCPRGCCDQLTIREKARTHYEKLVAFCSHADTERLELVEAKAYLAREQVGIERL